MNLSQLAAQASDYFFTDQRVPDGTPFVRTKDDTPDWIHDLVREAHGEFLPDDWRYAAVEAAIDYIAESEAQSADDLEDADQEFADAQVDVYTHDRLKWLASNLNRPGYCDQAQEDGIVAADTNIIDRIGIGQYTEAQEIWQSVVRSLTIRLEEAVQA